GRPVARDNAETLRGRLTNITPATEPAMAPTGPKYEVSVTAAAIVTEQSRRVVIEIHRSYPKQKRAWTPVEFQWRAMTLRTNAAVSASPPYCSTPTHQRMKPSLTARTTHATRPLSTITASIR